MNRFIKVKRNFKALQLKKLTPDELFENGISFDTKEKKFIIPTENELIKLKLSGEDWAIFDCDCGEHLNFCGNEMFRKKYQLI